MDGESERERLKKRLDVFSGGAARVSPEEAKEKAARHKAVLQAKKPETVYERLRRLSSHVKKRVSGAGRKISHVVRRRRKKKPAKVAKPRAFKLKKKRRLPA
jgi:hypothetical protein